MMNTKLKKNSIYLKYNFCNNNTTVKKLEVSIIILFFNKFVFIQQGFVKLIETVIVKIDIVKYFLNICFFPFFLLFIYQ